MFAEAAAALVAPALGKAQASALVAALAARAGAGDGDLRTLVRADPAFAAIDAGTIDAAFDVDAVAARAGELAIAQLDRLAARAAATGDGMDACHPLSDWEGREGS